MGTETLPSGRLSKEFDESSKYRLLGRGDLIPPACCATCGATDPERRYLDLAIWIEFFGQVYLCLTCVGGEIIETCGLLNETEVEFLQNSNSELAEKYAELEKRYEVDRERLNHFEALISGAGPITGAVSGVAVWDSSDSNEASSERTETSSESTESSSSEIVARSLRTERDDSSSGTGFEL